MSSVRLFCISGFFISALMLFFNLANYHFAYGGGIQITGIDKEFKSNEDEVIKVLFEIKNLAPKKVKVKGLKAWCSCTNITIDKGDLESGESSHVSLEWNTLGNSGVFKKNLVIEIENGEDVERYSVSLDFNINPLFYISEKTIKIDTKNVKDFEIIIRPNLLKNVSIIRCGSNLNFIKTQIFQKEEGYIIKCSVDHSLRTADFDGHGYVFIETDHSKYRFLNIGVMASNYQREICDEV